MVSRLYWKEVSLFRNDINSETVYTINILYSVGMHAALPRIFLPQRDRLQGKVLCVSCNTDTVTPGSPGKFLMAAFVRHHAQQVTAEIYPVQPIVRVAMANQCSVYDVEPHNLLDKD